MVKKKYLLFDPAELTGKENNLINKLEEAGDLTCLNFKDRNTAKVLKKNKDDPDFSMIIFHENIVSELDLKYPRFPIGIYLSNLVEPESYKHQPDNSNIHRTQDKIDKCLLSGDKFFVPDKNKKYMLIGELGIWGRLNKFTGGYDFIEVVSEDAEEIIAWLKSPVKAPDSEYISRVQINNTSFKKVWTFIRLIQKPGEFIRVLKRKINAFIHG